MVKKDSAMATLNVGVIGCGNIGATHADVYAKNTHTRLSCVCDMDNSRADALARKLRVKAYYSPEEMFAKEKLDVVSVCTSWDKHYQPTIQSLESGTHVLCEKPLSHNSQEAEMMVKKAKERKVKLGVNFNYRFTYTVRKAKELLDYGKLGNLCFINWRLTIGNPDDFTPYYHLIALHTHSFDLVRYFGGEVTRLQAFLAKPSKRPSYTTCSINLEFCSGCVGTIIGSYDMTFDQSIARLEIGGTKGRLVIENVLEGLYFYPHNIADYGVMGWEKRIFVRNDFDIIFYNRINGFIKNVLEGKPVEASGEDGLKAIQLVEASIQSFEKKKIAEF